MKYIQNKVITLVLACVFSAASYANSCELLPGNWNGEWKDSERSRQTIVSFTNVGKSGFFQGFYEFIDKPDVQVPFSGKCIDTEYGYSQLSFQGGRKPNVCGGLLVNSEELWMGCPFNHSNGIYRKQN